MTKYPSDSERDERVGAIAEALSNPRRRRAITRLCRGPATTTELADLVGASLPTMHQHLESLRAAGLIASAKHGRTVTHTVDLAPLSAIEDWIATRRSFWHGQLDALDQAMRSDPR